MTISALARYGCLTLLLTFLFFRPLWAGEEGMVIKLGTVAPEGSIWHSTLLQIRQDWHRISEGRVTLRIYPGGVLGGEEEMIRKIQRRGLDAVAISGSGLPNIDRNIESLNIPMLVDSYEELDFVREQLAAEFEAIFKSKQLRLLTWAEGGWVHFFTKTEARTPDDVRRLRLWTSPGNPEFEHVMKELGFQVVPLPATDMLTGLQTGLVEAIDVPPLFALLDGSYKLAGNLIELKWAVLNVAIVISTKTWNRVPDEYRAAMLAAAEKRGRTLRTEVRRADTEAVDEMRKRGLNVVKLTDDELAQWETLAEDIHPFVRGPIVEPVLFDKIMKIRQPRRN